MDAFPMVARCALNQTKWMLHTACWRCEADCFENLVCAWCLIQDELTREQEGR